MITEIFGGNCKRAKVFDLLLSHPHIEYSKSDISECAEISRVTLDTFIDKLVDYGILKVTRKIRNSQLYQINMDSSITQALNSFQNQLADIEFEKEMIECQKADPNIKPIKPFEEIVKNEFKKVNFSYFNALNEKRKEEIFILSNTIPERAVEIELVTSSEYATGCLVNGSTQKYEDKHVYNSLRGFKWLEKM